MQKFFKQFIIVAFLAHCHLIKPSEPSRITEQSNPHPLIIIFDPTMIDTVDVDGNQMSSMRQTLLFALIDESAPIIVSRSLWDYLNKYFVKEDHSDLSAITQVSKFKFDPLKWRTYTTQDELVMVLIPIAPKNDSYNISYGQHLESLNDLQLGIKAHKLKEIKDPVSLPIKDIDKKRAPSDLAKYLHEILITKHDLSKEQEAHQRWDIYLTGHGRQPIGSMNALDQITLSKDRIIAGMSPENFGKLLDFLNTKIKTRSLYYDSCFSGGFSKELYTQKVQNTETPRNLNFIIIAATTFNKETASLKILKPNMHQFSARPNFNLYFYNINAYLKGFQKDKNLTLADAIKPLSQWEYSLDFSSEFPDVMQLPTVRFPNTEWFNVLDVDKKLFRLNTSAIMRAVNSGNNQLTIPEGVDAILLETPYIPVSLDIKGQKMPLLVPQDIYSEGYFFRNIKAEQIALTANDQSTQSIIKMLFVLNNKLTMQRPPNYYIKELTAKLDFKKVMHENKVFALSWGNESPGNPLVFTHVALKETDIYLKYVTPASKQEKAIFSLKAGGYWFVGPTANKAIKEINFDEIEARIRKKSTLPEPILAETSRPIIGIIPREASPEEAAPAGSWKKENKKWITND